MPEKEILAAFTGAFFAFVFMRLSEMLTKIYERQVQNYNALVKLEYFCLEKVDTISLNSWIITDFQSVMSLAIKNNQNIIFTNKLHIIPFDDEVLLYLSHIGFINHVLEFKISIARVNNDIEMLNGVLADFRNGLMAGNIDPVTYKENMKGVLANSVELKKHLLDLEGKTIRTAAKAIVLSKDKPLLTKAIFFLCRSRSFSRKFQTQVDAVISKIEKERLEIKAASEKEIERIQTLS